MNNSNWSEVLEEMDKVNGTVTDKGTKQIYTQAMCDANIPPEVGCDFLVGEVEGDSRILEFKGKVVRVISAVVFDNYTVITFHHKSLGLACGNYIPFWVLPVETHTEEEKVIDELEGYLRKGGATARVEAEHIYNKYIKRDE